MNITRSNSSVFWLYKNYIWILFITQIIPVFIFVILKLATTGERGRSDACNAVRYRHARKSCATVERTIADARNAVRYRDARKPGATGERTIADARDVVSYRDARKSSAIV